MISDVAGLPLPVAVVRMARARRLRLRVDHDRGVVRLTVPKRYPVASALNWASEQRTWIEQQLAGAPRSVPFADGAVLPLEGQEIRILHDRRRRRGVRLEGDHLLVGGPPEGLEAAVGRWLRARARERLSEETARIAGLAGVGVRSVAVGDARGRWGSCSQSGAIRYSWRLILAPPDVLRFVVAHEVAHRLHMDHSPAFKAEERRLFGGDVAAARSKLRRLGPSLRAIGRR